MRTAMRVSPFLYMLAIVAGLLLPQAAPWASLLVLPALTIALTVALLRFPGDSSKIRGRCFPGLSGAA